MQPITKLFTVILIGLIAACGQGKKSEAGVKLENRIIDNANVLSQPQKDSIFNLIKNLEHEIGSQIAILTVDTLGEEQLEEFSLRMAEWMGLGRSTHNDGLLITLVAQERKVRIEVGVGLENIIKDEIAARIIRDDMAPLFREEKYGQGIYGAVYNISNLILENKELVGSQPVWK